MLRQYGWMTILGCAAMLLAVGCENSQRYDDLMAQNRIQQQRIDELENDARMCGSQLTQARQELTALSGRSGADLQAQTALIAALEADIEKKKSLIEKMQSQLLMGGAPLPAEMNVMLQQFAQTSDMIDFDQNTGSLKFKSDMLFDPGSDTVGSGAMDSIKALAAIMNTSEAAQFDLVIVGHTDDMRISRPQTLQKHPTNWHLSVHRSISVQDLLSKNGIAPDRMAVKGYGEYRPVEPNKANKAGNPVNRRVEVFIVPSVRSV